MADIKIKRIFPFDSDLLKISINLPQLEYICGAISSRGVVSGLNEVAWALKALTLTDLTTLSGDDTSSNVRRLCHHAAHPLPLQLHNEIDAQIHSALHAAAVCVYPARVLDARLTLTQLQYSEKVAIAAVATGFPSGQYSLPSRLQEIHYAIKMGAQEIDVVINRQLALMEDWKGLYREICEMRIACGEDVLLKTILAIGELGSMENVYKAAMTCMLAGANFIKTSTGKETVNAILPAGLVMINAIEDFYRTHNRAVGLKPAGGVRTVRDAIHWMALVKETLGNDWLKPALFRFGASGLLDDIVAVIQNGLSA